MRYPAKHKQETRKRIVRAAARRFRSRGSRGVGIGDLMRDLHLTHGGFYRHFESKEELFAEAFSQGADETYRKIAAAIEEAPPGGQVKALIDTYLDIEHCDNPAEGCPVAALAVELARRPPNSRARTAFERELKERTRNMARFIPGSNEEERLSKTRGLISGMAGTLTIARVLTDKRQRMRFLDDAKKFYLNAVGG
jgi:TetR/AcrR family transcriptional repressor of nem operon